MTYYDVTQLVHWQGKLAGIPRVMHELAIRFESEDPANTIFVSWVKEKKMYCEVNLGASLGPNSGVVYAGGGSDSATVAASSTGAKSQMKRLAKAGLRRSKKITPTLATKAETYLKTKQYDGLSGVEIKANDIIFIPWGEWWDPNFIQYLQNEQKAGARLMPIIHDIGPMVQPQFSGHSTDSLADYCREILPISSLVFVVSQHTKQDLIGWLKEEKLAVPKIEVFREGDDFQFAESIKPQDKALVNSGLKGQDYMLCVGTVEIKKNHALLYYVYKLAKQRGIELPKTVVVGRKGWKTETIEELITEDADTRGNIIFLHDTSDEELSWLYDHCLFSIFPSFYEGWGIPIAESLARGVPCLCSNTSSMVEIAEGIVEHFSPASSDECLGAIQKLLEPKNLATARHRAKQYTPTTWDDSFKQVMQKIGEV